MHMKVCTAYYVSNFSDSMKTPSKWLDENHPIPRRINQLAGIFPGGKTR